MQVFDASSMIYAWDNYPKDQFPGLWAWIAAEVNERRLMMSMVAYGEVCARTPDCGDWLATANLERLEVTNQIAQDAVRIKALLESSETTTTQRASARTICSSLLLLGPTVGS